MEVTDLTATTIINSAAAEELSEQPSKPTGSTRFGIGFDLNEIPSPSSFSEALQDPIDVVRAYQDNPPPNPGGPAGVPDGFKDSSCDACGEPEVRDHQVVVCDGCERGFHLLCAGMPGLHAVNVEEWICGECIHGGLKSKRWPLGVKSNRLLDINASPPSEGEADGDRSEELLDTRKYTGVDNPYCGNRIAQVTYSNLFNAGNGHVFQKGSEIGRNTVEVGFEDIFHQIKTFGRNYEDKDLSLRRRRNTENRTIRLPSQYQSDIFLQALRDFVSERHGILEEGWRVEFKQSVGSCELYAIYCAPDGKIFDSVFDVAGYLGLMPHNGSMEPKVRREGSLPLVQKTYLPKKKKSKRIAVANGFSDNKGSLSSDYCKELAPDGLSQCAATFGNAVNSLEAVPEKNGATLLQIRNEGLPLQFEDFFVLSLGEIDERPSYHDTDLVCPIGYRSCWHDKITGSCFICEVLDGGDSGPLFKIIRFSCSTFSIPIGVTIVHSKIAGHSVNELNEESKDMNSGSDGSIEMILSDPCPPSENDILSCLCIGSNGADVETSHRPEVGGSSFRETSQDIVSGDSNLRDEIGEITVEAHSSSSAWRKMCQKFIEACYQIYEGKSTVRFCCNHVDSAICFSSKGKLNFGLDRFCGYSSSVSIPSTIQLDNELDTFCNVLEKWLDKDRFGLDVEFVREMLEQSPGIQSCSRYQFLENRSHSSTLPTVANGVLEVMPKCGLKGKEEAVDALFQRSKKAKLAGEYVTDVCPPPPPGKPLCSKISPELIGDVYQVLELFSRFNEILGLKESLSLGEIEEELINPLRDGSNSVPEFDIEVKEAWVLNPHRGDSIGRQTASLAFETCENSHAFMQLETGAMKKAVEANCASTTSDRCFGVALTVAHISLLRVLINELQSKVAVLVDPNFDCGESKSKRGRKKDVENSVPAKRAKLNLLPLNELTWPELARRFILAVLSMDGNLDSVEVADRESSKVFRCLQGDGGVLCGSLTGVAGMEADAIFLAEAVNQIFGCLNGKNDVITLEEEVAEATSCSERVSGNGCSMPEWAQVLEPVKKLPTNVGTRIRKCVYEALEKNPPEWARKILEHSISKEVYKGNASGPTKKAVVSLLADVCGEGLPQKPDKGRKRKTIISTSELVMKQCRVVLRRAAEADDGKIFCNLLGRKIMNSSDNDDEGLLGSPAMIPRPLDFRTIDLRLAAGSYGRSHEAFLEDVRELWKNVRNAYGDQPDMVELADELSDTFESLYEKEVIGLVHNLEEYSKVESLDAERRKELLDLFASKTEIPKAPWEDGVCKVCGIDKDDDSVLLCDTCDAEYHTYCLNPPLSRIPEGNWYCPSCVVSKQMDALEHSLFSSQSQGKKFQGEVTRAYLDTLTSLAAVVEEKEYWEFSVDERTSLLKYLCDELLSSILVHQHLEQCAEASAELQQKMRSYLAEWKNLKLREEILALRVAKLDSDILVGESSLKDGSATLLANGRFPGQGHNALNGKPNCFNALSNELPALEGASEGDALGDGDKQLSMFNSDNKCENPVRAQAGIEDLDAAPAPAQNSTAIGNEPLNANDSNDENNTTNLPSADMISSQASPHSSPIALSESQAYHNELSSIKNDLSLLQDSITTAESELLKVSVRREFLGSDSVGRSYWASVTPDGHPQIVVSRNAIGQSLSKSKDFRDHVVKGPASTVIENSSSDSVASSPWVSYQADSEIEELVNWLKDTDPNDRELKGAILHWQKLKLRLSQRSRNEGDDEQLIASSVSAIDKITSCSSCLVTKAASLLEKKYGPCFESETTDALKKRVKRARLTSNDRMLRCECLEPIWPSRFHCLSCHMTFLTDEEFEGHNDGKCIPGPPAHEKNKGTSDSLRSKGNLKFETVTDECLETDTMEEGCSEFSSRLIKFQDDGCPYDFEVIRSKFVTNDSNKDLIQEIGLIALDGTPSFVPSPSPLLSLSTLMSVSPCKDTGASGDGSLAIERLDSERSIGFENSNRQNLSDNSLHRHAHRHAADDVSEVIKTNKSAMGCMQQKTRKHYLDSQSSQMGLGNCCVIPKSSLRPLVGKFSLIARQLKINLLDMDAALPEEALRPSKVCLKRRWAWRAFIKSARTIYEMVQATIVLEDMIKTDYLKNGWWYWSSLSAAAKTSTLSSLALRIYSLDSAIAYEKIWPSSDTTDSLEPNSQKPAPVLDSMEKSKMTRMSKKKRKEPEG